MMEKDSPVGIMIFLFESENEQQVLAVCPELFSLTVSH